MPVRTLIRGAARWRPVAWGALAALCAAACTPLQTGPTPTPPAAAAPAPSAPVPAAAPTPEATLQPQPDPTDQAARRLLGYHEQLRQMAPADVAADITRLGVEISPTDSTGSPDVTLALALALAHQHNPGDLARAAGLLEPITQATKPELQPWQPMARLLAGRIAEQRRLEDQLERQAAQRRDTQHTIQLLTEKLEALKAIERSMTTRPPGAPTPGAPPTASGTESPPAPKTP
jgi:hypothetical protein